MSDYKRLTKSYRGQPLHTDMEVTDGDEIYERLQLLEDKIENGTLIELPCKVGDTVYMPWVYDGTSGVAFNEVESIIVDGDGVPIVKVDDWGSDIHMPRYFTKEHFGDDIFLTKAEAEKKLQELREKK